jgi:hypothetical protein
LARIKDLFFDEFYQELEKVMVDIEKDSIPLPPPLLRHELTSKWNKYSTDHKKREGALISVDGGVQFSSFAYGDFVAVGRACALVHWPDHKQIVKKDVKIYVDEVFDRRDRGFIPSYVRMITEYNAAFKAAERVLDEDGLPIVVIDGSLYFGRFPYAVREYVHHGDLLAELFHSMTRLRCLGRDKNFPIIGITKDSTVFYAYMAMLWEKAKEAGLGRLCNEFKDAYNPMNLRIKAEQMPPEDKSIVEPFIEKRPLCDTALVKEVTETEGYTLPLLLAPSIYYGRDEDTPKLFERISRNIGSDRANPIIQELQGFFNCPGVAVSYWKPRKDDRPFRIDVSASWLGYPEPWQSKGNRFIDADYNLKPFEMILNHLGYWHVNPIEYNIPLKHVDMLARFDRELYKQKYEPFIVKRLKEAGLQVMDSRRDLREY